MMMVVRQVRENGQNDWMISNYAETRMLLTMHEKQDCTITGSLPSPRPCAAACGKCIVYEVIQNKKLKVIMLSVGYIFHISK